MISNRLDLMKIDEGVNGKIHAKVRQILNSKAYLHQFSYRICMKNCMHHCSRNLSSYLWSLESMSAIHCGKICKMLSLNTSCNFWRMDFCEQLTHWGKTSKLLDLVKEANLWILPCCAEEHSWRNFLATVVKSWSG